MYINTRYTRSNSQKCIPARAQVKIIQGWLHKKENMAQDIQKYWPIRQELAVIDGVDIKGKQIIILSQMQILSQLHSNHIGIKKMRLLMCESIYWIDMNADIEKAAKHCLTFLEYQICSHRKKQHPTKFWPTCGR